jgi:hypothetical protein
VRLPEGGAGTIYTLLSSVNRFTCSTGVEELGTDELREGLDAKGFSGGVGGGKRRGVRSI